MRISDVSSDVCSSDLRGVEVSVSNVDERVGRGVTLVLGQVDPAPTTGDGGEGREVGLEAVLPLLDEPQLRVPLDGTVDRRDSQDRDDLLRHRADANASHRPRARPGAPTVARCEPPSPNDWGDRKSTRLNSST